MTNLENHEEEFSVDYLKRLFGYTTERWYALDMKEAHKKALRRIDYITIYYNPLVEARAEFNYSKDFFELLYYICIKMSATVDAKMQKEVIAELKSFVEFYTDHTVNIYLKPKMMKDVSLQLYSSMVKMLGYLSKQSEILSRISTIKRISSNYIKFEQSKNVNIQAIYTRNYIEESKFFEEFLTMLLKTHESSKFVASLIRYDFKISKKFKR